jgi:hypothetical protein
MDWAMYVHFGWFFSQTRLVTLVNGRVACDTFNQAPDAGRCNGGVEEASKENFAFLQIHLKKIYAVFSKGDVLFGFKRQFQATC